ncbi:CDP-glucose 4,6-dehydratase [Paenibacillus sp. MCAF9]|uniref:CDP-glucose 4,6-dehydratase n=1 Tax=unclassified Paenibacillus TaxID=185978 RepID=UPI003F98FD76
MMSTFWNGKRVFITGHTGFKGSWLAMWLQHLGAEVTGYSLLAPTEPSLFNECKIETKIHASIIGDIRDFQSLHKAMVSSSPEIVIHMAAQPLVRYSYEEPVETYSVNVMGTVNLLEAVRLTGNVKAVVNVTTDKCYENKEWQWGYREVDVLGGYDPYSNSKACSELVTASYRDSFFNKNRFADHGVAIASARAGNVIGGGDWAKDRLIPDCINSLLAEKDIVIRNPSAIRPWQHVLEPLSGYMKLAQRLYEEGTTYAESWNFGPNDSDAKPVSWIVERMCDKWGGDTSFILDTANNHHEAHYLKLDCSKAHSQLEWKPRWSLDYTIDKIIEWTLAYRDQKDMYDFSIKQIVEYVQSK